MLRGRTNKVRVKVHNSVDKCILQVWVIPLDSFSVNCRVLGMRYVLFLQFQQMEIDYISLWVITEPKCTFWFGFWFSRPQTLITLKTVSIEENVLSLWLGWGLGQVSERLIPLIGLLRKQEVTAVLDFCIGLSPLWPTDMKSVLVLGKTRTRVWLPLDVAIDHVWCKLNWLGRNI